MYVVLGNLMLLVSTAVESCLSTC